MKKVPTLNMPTLTNGLLNNRKTLPAPALRSAAVSRQADPLPDQRDDRYRNQAEKAPANR
jgi:hypothetical protein